MLETEVTPPNRSDPGAGHDRSIGFGLTRRRLLGRMAAAGPLAWIIAACGGGASGTPEASDATAGAGGVQPAAATDAPAAVDEPTTEALAEAPTLAPTPACPDDDDPTPAQTEGPFYTPDTPERASLLEPGMVGTVLVVTGRVVDTDCRPISGALLDFWHSDDAGVYDNAGYRLRGHQFADSDGAWRLETIMPGVYTGRTRHIHVRVQPPGVQILTTQLYFPGEAANARDGIYRPELELTMAGDESDGSRSGTFDFVLAIG